MTRVCDHCDDWLQDLLDGNEPGDAVLEHLSACPECRELHDSAVALRQGLALLPPPAEAPDDLSDRVVTAVLFDRKRRQKARRLIARVAALAAGVLLAVLLTEAQPRPRDDRVTVSPPSPKREERMPSLRQSVARAGSVVGEVASRKLDEALESTRGLWPVVDSSSLPAMDIKMPLESTARPLQTATQGVSAGLEPVAGSARRAFALFVRDLSPGASMAKPGS
jgi:hypothetical protein